jgi:hypothetical protein
MRDRYRPPLILKLVVDPTAIQRLVELRLSPAYAKVAFAPKYPSYPFAPAFFQHLKGASPREVLKACDAHRAQCQRQGKVFEFDDGNRPPPPPPSALAAIRTEFLALRATANVEALLTSEDEEALDTLLEAACIALVRENPVPEDVDAQVDFDFLGAGSYDPLHARVRLVYRSDGDREKHFAVRFLQKSQHTAFQARLKAAMTASGIDQALTFRRLVLFRRGVVPGGAATARLVQELQRRGGVFVEPSMDELCTLWALARMLRDKPETASVVDWLRADRVVSKLASFAPAVEYLFSDSRPRLPGASAVPDTWAKTVAVEPVENGAALGKPSSQTPNISFGGPPPPCPSGGPVAKNIAPLAGSTVSALSGLYLGKRIIGQTVKDPFIIPLKNLAKHVVVLAGAGSGKTVLVRRMVEEAALLGLPSIVVDGANDLSRLGDPWPETPPSFDSDDQLKAARYAANAEVIIWTPGRNDGNPIVLDPLPRFADLKDSESELDAAIQMARASLEPMAILSAGAAGQVKAGLLAAALRHFAKSGGGSLRDLIELLAELPPEATGGYDKAEKLGRDIADALRAARDTNPILRGVGASLDPAVLFGIRTPSKTRISVINLSGLPDLTAQQHFVNQLAMTLFTWIKKYPPKDRPIRGLLVVDEARDFVPSGKSVPGKESLIRLVAQARKYGLGIVFATQAPKSIDHNVIHNCSTQFFGRASSPAAIETVQEQLQARGGSGHDIAKLARGCFYAFTDGLTAPLKIEVPLCLSYHPSNPPDETEVRDKAVRSRAIV